MDTQRNYGDAINGEMRFALSMCAMCIYEKKHENKFDFLWTCRWNKKCRARVYTIDGIITTLNKYHTHEDIIYRKKRVSKKLKSSSSKDEEQSNEDVDYLIVQTDKKDQNASEEELDETAIYVTYDNWFSCLKNDLNCKNNSPIDIGTV